MKPFLPILGFLGFLACSSTQTLELGQEAPWKEKDKVLGKIIRVGDNSYEFYEDRDGNGIYEKVYLLENDELAEVRFYSKDGKLKQKLNFYEGNPNSSLVYSEDGSLKAIAYFEGKEVVSVEIPQIKKTVDFRTKK